MGEEVEKFKEKNKRKLMVNITNSGIKDEAGII